MTPRCINSRGRGRTNEEFDITNPTACTEVDCDRPARSRGLCQTHYDRWRKLGDPGGPIRVRTRNKGKSCKLAECERPARMRGWCDGHYRQWRLGREPAGQIPSSGERKDVVTYNGMHARLKRDYGLASEHPCVDCGLPAEDWSYDNSGDDELFWIRDGRALPYCLDPSHYAPRCKQCHVRFDLSDGVATYDVNIRADRQRCAHGHLLDDDNTYVRSNGQLVCRKCRRDRVRNTYHLRKANGLPVR